MPLLTLVSRRATRASSILPVLLGGLVALSAADARANALDHLRTTDDIGLNKVPHEGQSRVLVIPVRVGDPFTEGQWQQLVDEFATEGGPGTFRDFWLSQSGGRYDPIPTLVPPIIYPECPIPEIGASCRIDIDDFQTLISGQVHDLLVEIFERVRDEYQIDLSEFDINGKDCPADEECPDGYFDGVVLRTSMFQGIAFPLAALGNAVTVETTPRPWNPPDLDAGASDASAPDLDAGEQAGLSDAGDDDGGAAPSDAGDDDAGAGPPDAGPAGPSLTCGIIALIPPDYHEYGHTLGLIDLYNGPTVNGLMSVSNSGLSAFSRLALGWGEDEEVTGPGTYQLPPVEEGGSILRFGQPPRYVLIENRAGESHALYDDSHPGVYLYSVDEEQLPTTPLGFFDALGGSLYFPNESPPYLNVGMPLECSLGGPGAVAACVLATEGGKRDVEHSRDGFLGYHVELEAVADDGTVQLAVRSGRRDGTGVDAGPEPDPEPDSEPDPMPDSEPDPEPDPSEGDCGCTGAYGASWPALILGLGLLARRGRRARRREST